MILPNPKLYTSYILSKFSVVLNLYLKICLQYDSLPSKNIPVYFF